MHKHPLTNNHTLIKSKLAVVPPLFFFLARLTRPLQSILTRSWPRTSSLGLRRTIIIIIIVIIKGTANLQSWLHGFVGPAVVNEITEAFLMWLITLKELQGLDARHMHAACLKWRCANFSIFSPPCFQTLSLHFWCSCALCV